MSSAAGGKDTIYVDIDDEITAIIEKVRGSNEKIVALVLPKRATVLQSIVNMKLLKRTADEDKKNLVLITNETGLLPLAGSVGLHVASTLQSKPEIPSAPEGPSDEPEDIDEPLDMVSDDAADDGFDPAAAAATPIGALAGDTPKPPAIDDTFELDNSDGALDAKTAVKPKKPKGNKKLKIPNFDSFRNKLILGFGILALLIVGWIFAFVVLPKATITIHTDTSTIPTNLTAIVDTSAKTLDPATNTVPATAQTEQKTFSQQVPATGQQNNGNSATGSITMTAQKCSGSGNPANVPSGTGVSTGGLTYITQDSATFHITGFNAPCATYSSNPVGITAQSPGAKYNTSDNVTFTVSGRSDASATGSATGGTDNISKVVTQADIDGAKAKITATDTTSIQQDLQNNLEGKALFPITATFLAGDPQVSTSASAGTATDTVTVTEIITYSMLGVQKSDLKTLVVANVKTHIDSGKQIILDDGVDKATFAAQNHSSANSFTVAMSTKSTAGPDINLKDIKKQVAGKKSGEVSDNLKAIPGVTSVDVKYSPFWVSSIPKNTSKITVQLYKSGP